MNACKYMFDCYTFMLTRIPFVCFLVSVLLSLNGALNAQLQAFQNWNDHGELYSNTGSLMVQALLYENQYTQNVYGFLSIWLWRCCLNTAYKLWFIFLFLFIIVEHCKFCYDSRKKRWFFSVCCFHGDVVFLSRSINKLSEYINLLISFDYRDSLRLILMNSFIK